MRAYLDNSATTRPTDAVIEAMRRAMSDEFYNPSSLYAPALAAEQAIERCRAAIQQKIRAPGGQIVFTSGGTEANNLAILGSLSAMHGAKHVILSAQEHPSIRDLESSIVELGHRVSILPVDFEGQPQLDVLRALCKDPPALVSCMQVNNETGATPDLSALRSILREAAPEALLHVDGVQGFLRMETDARQFDLYTLSAHKIHGPKGIGALWMRPGVRVKPRQIGGGQENGLRSGTQNAPGIAGFYQAIAEISAIENIEAQLREKKLALYEGIRACVPNAQPNGPAPEKGAAHILNISLPGVRAEVMLHALEAEGIYCSTGSACSSRKRKQSPVLLAMRVDPALAESALRLSLSPFTKMEEIEYAALEIGRAYGQLKRFVRR